LLMPAYPGVLENASQVRREYRFDDLLGESVSLLSGVMPDSDLPIWLVDCPSLYQRSGSPYQDPDGSDWPDNARRYAVLSHVAARLALGRIPSHWRPDIVHCHDWHTGLVPALLQSADGIRPRSIFTVHNAAFQGNFPLHTGSVLDLGEDRSVLERLEFHGELSYLKAGLEFADRISTVSPTYSRELRTREFGCGLEYVFERRAGDLSGIMNGIDLEIWNPGSDPYIAQCYTPFDMRGKEACKRELQQLLGLKVDARAPLAMFASRITGQKMADILVESLPDMMRENPDMQFAMLGCGERDLERRFVETAERFPGRASVQIGYSEAAAHRLHAGADILLHGSRFEPCGLTQLYAMRYGTVPVVRRIGGLADSVVDAEAEDCGAANGIVFEDPSAEAMAAAVRRCIDLYGNHSDQWRRLRTQGMSCDFGWERSAGAYRDLYREVLGWVTEVPALEGATATAAESERRDRMRATLRRLRRVATTQQQDAGTVRWSRLS
jgi:starch synthase